MFSMSLCVNFFRIKYQESRIRKQEKPNIRLRLKTKNQYLKTNQCTTYLKEKEELFLEH